MMAETASHPVVAPFKVVAVVSSTVTPEAGSALVTMGATAATPGTRLHCMCCRLHTAVQHDWLQGNTRNGLVM